MSLQDAYDRLCDMYEDPDSPLAKLCRSCEWWIMWAHRDSMTPYGRSVFPTSATRAWGRILRRLFRRISDPVAEVTLCPGVERGAGLERGLGWVELPGSRVDVTHALRSLVAPCVPRGTAPVTREV